VNKHQFTAAIVAILGVAASLVLWTGVIRNVPLPQFSRDTVVRFEKFLDQLTDSMLHADQITVREVMVEDLGTHFASSVDETHVRASVIENSERVLQELPAFIPNDQPVIHAAAGQLEQWGLSRAWSITIPSLGIRAPVLLPSMKNWTARAWDLLEEQMQIGLNHGAVAYPHSSGPGRKGNLIIAGHSSPPTESAAASEFGNLFEKLPGIQVGDEISIVTAGSPITYRVEEKTIVSPQMTSILEQQYDESILKLITCYPVGTTRDRMIVLAKRIEG
jgi:LPXTG-site transpeptidase (sortase) family protein|tara:strand:- start:13410 stop:14237 length:828 start_codon:yes stop_codon:yes gene_type:complete